jgi:hypothetical protein
MAKHSTRLRRSLFSQATARTRISPSKVGTAHRDIPLPASALAQPHRMAIGSGTGASNNGQPPVKLSNFVNDTRKHKFILIFGLW